MKRPIGILSGLSVLMFSLSGCATSERIERDLVSKALAPPAPRASTGRSPRSIPRLGAGDALGSSILTRYVAYMRTGGGARSDHLSATAEADNRR